MRALELLLGRYPATEIAIAARLPAMPVPVPAGMPSQLLERRPDVFAAERRVAAAFDRVGEARAAQLPRISLTAGGSSVSSDLIELKDTSNPLWSLGANLIAPIYQGGALRAQVEIRTAEQKQAVAEYARAAQRAFGEVEGALAAEVALREREAILEATMRDSARALELACRITARGGTTVSAGLPHPQQQFTLPHLGLVAEERTIKGSYLGSCVPSRDIPRYIDWYRAGRLPVDRLLSERLRLEDLNAAFDRLAAGESVRQVVELD